MVFFLLTSTFFRSRLTGLLTSSLSKLPARAKEAEMSTLEENRLTGTRTQKEFLADLWACPTAYFDEYPVDWVRDECLKALGQGRYLLTLSSSDWAERWILFLLGKEPREAERAFKILSWYLFANSSCGEGDKETDLAVRAIEFAIGLSENTSYSLCYGNRIAKDVTGRLCKRDGAVLYPEVKGIKEYLNGLIMDIWEVGIVRRIKFQCTSYSINKRSYLEDGWHNLERALKVILHMEDFSFISMLDQTLQFIHEGTSLPEYGPHFQKKLNIVVLEESIANLRRICKQKIREKNAETLQKQLSAASGM